MQTFACAANVQAHKGGMTRGGTSQLTRGGTSQGGSLEKGPAHESGDQVRNDGVVEGEGWLRAGGVVRGRRAVTWLCAAGW